MIKIQSLCSSREPQMLRLPAIRELQGVKALQFGQKKVDVQPAPAPDRNIHIGRDLWQTIGLPDEEARHFQVLTIQDTLFLLPLIGAITTGAHDGPDPFGERTKAFEQLAIDTARRGGCMYFFSPQHADKETETITALTYLDESWKRHAFPYPNIVYNLMPNRKSENHPAYRTCKEALNGKSGIPWYNDGFLNKFSTYDMVRSHPLAQEFLPECWQDLNARSLKSGLKKYGAVSLVPRTKKTGIEQKDIIRTEDGNFVFRTGSAEERYSSLKGLVQEAGHEFLYHKQFYVQQGLFPDGSSPVRMNFRVHTNKDYFGTWQVTAIAVQKTATDFQHQRKPDIQLLSEVFSGQEETRMKNLIHEAAKIISESIDNHPDSGLFGELGLDFTLDDDHRLWLIDASAKPSAAIFTHPGLEEAEKGKARLRFDYFCHLAQSAILHPSWFHKTV